MNYRINVSALILATSLLGLSTTSLHAETLHEALAKAYRNNPTLNGARAGQRATDEAVPQAMSGWRPTVSANVSVAASQAFNTLNGVGTNIGGTQESFSIQLRQPLFDSGRTKESVGLAKAQVMASRQQLLGTESQVLLSGVKAYVDVLRDRQILALRRESMGVLQKQARAAKLRFEVGELTRTDVAQANASVASAKAALAGATASLRMSEAAYIQVIGHKPAKLSSAPMAKLPGTFEKACAIATKTNPQILAAIQFADMANHGIGIANSALLPSADLQASYNFTASQAWGNAATSTGSTLSVQGVLTVPIYDAGLASSKVREAKHKASQSRLSVVEATRTVRQNVAMAWEGLQAARQSSEAAKTAVEASGLAYEGMNEEFEVGSRSTVELLNSYSALLGFKIAKVSAEHDQLLASYQVQAAIGRLNNDQLGLGQGYDVQENYKNVKGKWRGTDVETINP